MNVLGKIRRLRFREGLSVSEISRRLGVARNTVKRWLKSDGATEPKYQRNDTAKLITAYEADLRKWLEADARRPKRDRRTALALFRQLRERGFKGSYTRVTEFVRRWRTEGGVTPSGAFVPLHFEFGEAFQFDWSEETLVVGGFVRKLQVAHVKLCASP